MKNLSQLTVAVLSTLFFTVLSSQLKSQWNPAWYPGSFDPQTLGDPNVKDAAPWAIGGNKIQQMITFPNGWNNYTCGTDDGAFFSLMANGVPQINLTGNQIGMGGGFWPSTPGCYLEIKGQGSNFRIFGDAAGTVESSVDMKINYGVNTNNLGAFYLNQGGVNITPVPRFKLDGNGNGTFYKALQVNNQVTAGIFGFTPPANTKFIANAQTAGEGGVLVYANNGNNALYVANSAGAGRFRMWVNSGGGDDSKLHMSGSAQFGFTQGIGMMDNTTRLNVDAGSLNGVKVSTSSSNAALKAFYVENTSGSTPVIPFEVLQTGATRIGLQRVPSRAGSLLQVSGEIDCQSLYVLKPATWQDRVFDKAYTLPSLNEVETYINSNKHLPGIKSEKEILENGYDVNEIDAALLEKIENLYLYIIKQQKEIDVLKNKLAGE